MRIHCNSHPHIQKPELPYFKGWRVEKKYGIPGGSVIWGHGCGFYLGGMAGPG
jgi:hypothetical protein